jgi:hypothetical protein
MMRIDDDDCCDNDGDDDCYYAVGTLVSVAAAVPLVPYLASFSPPPCCASHLVPSSPEPSRGTQ